MPTFPGVAVSTFQLPVHVAIEDPEAEAREPTLKEILTAVHTYGSSLTHFSIEVKNMKEELLNIRHDMQMIRGRAKALEGRVSMVEDELPPLAQDVHSIC